MDDRKELTVEQVLRITVNQLNNIPVPISCFESVGAPIKQAIDNLRSCLTAFENAEKQLKKDSEPQIEIISEDQVSPNEEVTTL